MARLTMKERFEFDVLTDAQDRLVYMMLERMACDGHGDVGACGVAEFNLMDFAAALEAAPGETLRRLKRIAPMLQAVCVEHENTVLFALAGAPQDDFEHLYKRCGFVGLPPNLPRVKPRVFRI